MAMNHNLVTIPNLQYEPIAIPDYTVLELYKDNVAEDNYLGYYIVPISGLTTTEIETKLTTLAGTQSGYTNFVILASADNSKKEYNHKRVFGIFYNDTSPTYPTYTVAASNTVTGSQVNVWQEETVTNNGIEVPCTVTLTVVNNGEPIEFYINSNYVSIENYTDGALVVNSTAQNEGKLVDVNFYEIPALKHGQNTLKVKATNVTKVEVTYTETY